MIIQDRYVTTCHTYGVAPQNSQNLFSVAMEGPVVKQYGTGTTVNPSASIEMMRTAPKSQCHQVFRLYCIAATLIAALVG